jgi:hypothetical protein
MVRGPNCQARLISLEHATAVASSANGTEYAFQIPPSDMTPQPWGNAEDVSTMPTSAELLSGLGNKTNKQEILRDAVGDPKAHPPIEMAPSVGTGEDVRTGWRVRLINLILTAVDANSWSGQTIVALMCYTSKWLTWSPY